MNAVKSRHYLLPPAHRRAQNESVRIQFQSALLSLTLLGACLAATAQYQDRDTDGAPKTSATAPAPKARVDINQATFDELLRIPGMTPTWAARIVRFRPYRTRRDLLDQGVVTNEVYDRIKDYVVAHRDKQ